MLNKCAVCGDTLPRGFTDNLCSKCRRGPGGKSARHDLNSFTKELRGPIAEDKWDDTELRKAISTKLDGDEHN